MRALTCGTFLFCLPALAAELSPAGILQRAVEAERRNARLAWSYTFQEERTANHETRTYDVLFLEGAPYRRLMARNGRPLSGNEDRGEQRRMDQESARRKAESPDQRHRRLFRRAHSYQIPFAGLPRHHDLRLAGEETRNGRRAWRIEASPRPVSRAHWRQTLWIDQQDFIRAALEAEVLDEALELKRGSRVAIEKTRHADGVWLPSRYRVDYQIGRNRGFTETVYRQYRKFQSDSILIPLEEADIP